MVSFFAKDQKISADDLKDIIDTDRERKGVNMSSLFSESECSDSTVLRILSAVLLQRHVFRLAQNRTALFLCRFCRRTSAEHTNVDYGAGTDGGHGRPLCQRCAAGTHSRHRSGSDRLEKHPFRICQYRLLGNSGIADRYASSCNWRASSAWHADAARYK